MSTMDPTGDGGGGGTSTSVDDNVTPVTPSTGISMPPGSHHQQHPPPSPLSGCYLLVVLPEPHTAQHRDLILNRLAKGFLSWDKDSCHVDLEKELQALVAQAPEGEEARNGERLIQYATENLVTEVLIHPQTNTLLQCIRNLLASFTKHRHIIHAGYTFGGNGSWILQDGTFSLADFLDAFSEHEVQRVLRAYENSVTVDINCAGVGDWSTSRLSKEACTRSCRVRLNPDDVLTAGVPAIASFTNYVGQYLVPQTLDQLMEPSDVVGNIRFSHPTLYVFPGGQGDAALFGINGFNMLVDGGFARKACFWDFARHLDRLDAVLVTRINNSNVGGMSSVLRKKREMHVYPQIGHFFCNLVERRHSNSPDGDKDLDPLILNLTDIGQDMMVNLRQINLRAHPCYRDPNPINLYHKVGHGTLDMYVLSPSKDSREVREFLAKWHASDSKLFAGSHRKDSNNLTFPIQNLASICALLVWQPANPEDTITRILFPGSTPQHKIFEGFERLKHLDFLKHPVCSAKSLSPSTSLLTLKDRPTIKQKLSMIEKDAKKSDVRKEKRDPSESKLSKVADELTSKSTPQPSPIIPIPKSQPAKVDVKSKKVVENKKIETESKKIERDLKEIKKDTAKKDPSKIEKDSESKKSETPRIKMDGEKPKESKPKPEPKKKESRESKPLKVSKTETPQKPIAKIPEKKPKAPAEKKDTAKPSPPTPKKSMNGSATKVEVAKSTPKPISRPAPKQPISTMPAKSAKDANNRKVVEQKNIEIASAASAAVPAKVPAKPKAAERKPISRRGKPVSPSKARVPGSPAKSTRSTPTTSVKSDKDGVIRKVKGDRGTTDSSTVSTPSGIEIDSMTKLADKSLTEKSEDMSLDSIESKVLADLKEEREVVEEIEAVLQKAERIEEARKDDHLDGDDDVTAEATDKKEDDMTEDDVTADIDEVPKKESSRKASQELTEEDEYLIVEKEEIYIEDSAQSGEGEQKHVLDAVESEKAKKIKDIDSTREEEETEVSEEKEKSDVPEKKVGSEEETEKEKEADDMSTGHKEQLDEEMKEIIASAAEIVQKTEEKDDSGKKDSEDITKEPSSLSPDKFDSSEKKTTDTDMKPEVDQKDQQVREKMEESQERISTLESGATTTAPTLPEDERIPLDDIKEVVDERCAVDEVKEKDSVEQVKESFVAPMPTEPKPEAKPFEVRPPLQGVQREIVKTPDEVADLPVHEEVDPKLYRMDDFEKGKDDKAAAAAAAQPQETKEPPTPPVKEQKGVFSFFGKVADKFEKGMDKLTGKSRRDSEKDIDEKSSSKSSSPKEVKPQEIAFPGEAQEIKPAAAKVDKTPETSEAFEKGEPVVSQVKVAAIMDTAAFLHGEIEELKKSAVPEKETKDSVEAPELLEPIFETCVLKGEKEDKSPGAMVEPEGEVEEDVEDVEALLEEASKKFKTVKDSLHDSLESLEDKIVEEEMVRAELAAASKDVVKDTLSEVVEKLEEIKPQIEETKESEKVKFEIPKADELEDEEEDSAGITKDFKEAVRDVGEVLAGSAGILIEEKPKDVIEIVKKVAEVLKKDDFLSHDVLFDKDAKETPEKIVESEDQHTKTIVEDIMMPKKVGVTVELPPQEEVDEMLLGGVAKSLTSYAAAGDLEMREDPCVKTIKEKGSEVMSPSKDVSKDAAKDKTDAMNLCADLMQEEPTPSRRKRSLRDEDQTKPDVMEAGIESVCVKQEVKHQVSEEDAREIEGTDIVFDRKVSPAKAEIVMMTPDSTPTSPKFPMDKIHAKELEAALEEVDEEPRLAADIKNALDKEGPLEKIIEDLVFTNKTKITIEIVEYITVVRKIPREKVIYIIEEIIIKKGVPRDSVVADLDLLRPDSVTEEKRSEIEHYIDQEYITKNKRITIEIVEEISIKKFVTKRIVIEIIEEIIVKRKIPREKVVDISDKELSQIGVHPEESSAVSKESVVHDDEAAAEPKIESATADKPSEIEDYIVAEIISKGKKITPQLIDDVCVAKRVPRRVFIEIIEEIIIRRKIPRSTILDISEKELSELLATEKEDTKKYETISKPEEEEEEVDAVSPEKRLQIEQNIFDDYVAKNRRITPYAFEEICVQNKIPRRVIIEIIEEIIVKRKLARASVIDISDNELEELLAADDDEMDKESIAARSEEEDDEEGDDEREDDEISEVCSEADADQITSEKRSEIENSIVEEFVSKGKRITPYIFEDICVRFNVPRRIVVEIIEEIVVKRKIPRNSLLDITETELTELLAAVEAEEDHGIDKKEALLEHAEEDKLVDGFVSISSKDDVPKVPSSISSKTIELAEPALKETEKDVDDFEAVEQEYKLHGAPIAVTKDSSSIISVTKSDEKKITDETDEAIEDDTSEVVEAEEKIIATVPKAITTESTTAKLSEETPDVSEIVDTTEKYLIEAQEKTEPKKHEAEKLADQEEISDRKHSPIEEERLEIKAKIPEVSTAALTEIATKEEVKTEEPASKTSEEAKKAVETEIEDVTTDSRKPSIVEITEKLPETTKQEVTDDKTVISRAKRSTDAIPPTDRKFSIQESEAPRSGAESPKGDKSADENDDDAVPTVRRMVVTASSEDGGHETEVCPTGSITFTKAVTPDDSLKSSPVKTTPDQDSLQFDKESLRSGASTPEKDSISGKSTPGTKDGDKITPEDSLDKSPSVARDSQDLEDSLDKSDLTKSKEIEKPKPLVQAAEEVHKKPEEIIEPSKKEDSTSISAPADSHSKVDTSEKSIDVAKLTHVKEDKPGDEPVSLSAKEEIVKVSTDKAIDSLGKVSEKLSDKSPSPIAGDKMEHQEDSHPEKPSELAVSPGKSDEKEKVDTLPGDLSKSPSIASKEDASESIAGTKSPTPSLDEKEIDDQSKRSSLAGDKIPEVGHPIAFTPISLSVATEKDDDEGTIGGAKSPSAVSDISDRFKSPVVHAADDILQVASESPRSRSSSIASQKLEEKDKTDKAQTDEKVPIIVSDKDDSKDVKKSSFETASSTAVIDKEETTEDLKVQDRSRSGSVVSDKSSIGGKQEPIDRSRSGSIVGDKETELHAKHDEIDERSKSPSVTSEKDTKESLRDSRSPSIVSEKHEKLVADAAKSPSIAGDKLSEKDIAELDEKESLGDAQAETDSKEPLAKSRTPSLVGEKIDDKTQADRSKSPSIAGDKHSEKDIAELDGKDLLGGLKSPSIGDKPIEKDLKEPIDKSRSPSVTSEKPDDKLLTDHSKSPSITSDKHSEKDITEIDDEEPVHRSREPSIAGDTRIDKILSPEIPKQPLDHSRSPGIAGDKLAEKDSEEQIHKSGSPSIIDEKIGDKTPADHSKSPSVASEKLSEKDIAELEEPSIAVDTKEKQSLDRSRSPSIAGDKDSKEPSEKSGTPSLTAEKIDAKSPADRSKSPSVASDRHSEKDIAELDEEEEPPTHRSRASSIGGDKHSELDDAKRAKSRSPSISGEKHDEKQSSRSRSPSIAGDKPSEKDITEPLEKSRSPSVISEKIDAPIAHSKSPSVASDKHSEKDIAELEEEITSRSREPSIVGDIKLDKPEPAEKHEEKQPVDRSRSSSIIGEKDTIAPADKSRSPSIIGDKLDEKAPIDRSRSPSIAGDKPSETDSTIITEKSGSPSVSGDKPVEKEPTIRSRSSSIVAEKPGEMDSIVTSDKSRSPSIVGTKPDEKASTDRSRSPSVSGDKPSEKDSISVADKSRSPSIASDKTSEKDLIAPADKSRSPSIASDKPSEKDSIAPADKSRSPSIASDKPSEKDSIAPADKSRSPSIASDKPDEKTLIDRSKSPSIAGDKHSEKDITELDDEVHIDRSKSPSVAGDKHSEKDITEIDDEVHVDRSKSPSLVGDKHSEKDAKEPSDKGDAIVSAEHSKSPTSTGDKHSEKEFAATAEKSRSPSIVGEQHEDEKAGDRSRSQSIAEDKITDIDFKDAIDKPRSPSIAAEKPSEKDEKLSEKDEKPSEKDEQPIEKSRSPSIADKEEKEVSKHDDKPGTLDISIEKVDEKAPMDRSKSPSIAGDAPSEKDAAEVEKSVPSGVIEAKLGGKSPIDRSRSSSIADDKDVADKADISRKLSIASEKTDEKAPIDRSKSPSIADEKQSEKSLAEGDAKSGSPSIDGDKLDEKDTIDRSRSPSIAGDKPSEKEVTEKADISRKASIASEKPDEKMPIDGSKSPSIAGDKPSEKEVTDKADISRKASIASEKPDEKMPIDGSKSPSIAGDKHSEKDLDEEDAKSKSPSIAGDKDDKLPVDRSRSPSIAGDKEDAKEHHKSRSASIASEKPDEKATIDRSKSPSIAGDKPAELDLPDLGDKSRSPSVATEKIDDKESIDHSRSPSIAGDKHGEESVTKEAEKSKSPSIDSEKLEEKTQIDRSKSPSVADEKLNEIDVTAKRDESRSSSIASEKPDDKAPIDRSKSPSIAGEKDVTEQIEKSRSSSIASEKPTEIEQPDRSRSPSVAGDKSTDKDSMKPIEKSRSPSITGEKHDEQEPIDLSKQSSEILTTARSRSSSIAVDHEKSPEPSKTLESSVDEKKITAETHEAKEKAPTAEKLSHSEEEKPDSGAHERKSRSASIQSDSFELDGQKKVTHDESIEKSTHIGEAKPTDTRKDSVSSVASVHDSKLDEREAVQALQKLAETIADKSAETKHPAKSPLDETVTHETPKDRSRSHSLFDTGDRTPLGRSRAASLFEDKVPDVLSLHGETKTAFQVPGATYIYDESEETKDDSSRKSSLKDIPDDTRESFISDSRKSSIAKEHDTKRYSMAIQEDIAGQFADDYHTKVEEYIVDRYIVKKEKITLRVIDEIVAMYSMPKYMILRLIEAIIEKKNVPRDSVVDYPKDDEIYETAVSSRDDHVDVIDDIPVKKRNDIESYINDEFLAKNKVISTRNIDDLANLKSVSRYIIIMIIEEFIIKRKIARASLVEDGILDGQTVESSRPAGTDSKRSSLASIASHGPIEHDDRFEEENLPSVSADYKSPSTIQTSEIRMGKETPLSEEKRVEVESYVMEECVKKGRKITVLVLEQIMSKLLVSRPVLLDIIENIIVTRKMSRKTMVDDAIYDDIEAVTSKSTDYRLDDSTGKSTPEFVPSKDRIAEFSGKSTPDPKSSGYSTPEIRQYDKDMSYSADYESPFHKAFVGGMTEIRTTHITTLSGKSTPDFGTRGETPESLSESMTSSSQAKTEERVTLDKVSPPHEHAATTEQAPSISANLVTMTTTGTTVSSALDSAQKSQATSVPAEQASAKQFPDDHSKMVKQDIGGSETTAIMGEIYEEEEEPEVIRKVIRREIIEDDDEPEVIKKVIRREIIEDDEPEIITRIIRREIVEQGDDSADEYEQPVRVTRRISTQEGSPEIVETITTRTTKTIVTEDSPEKVTSEPISADVKRTVTTVTTVTEPDGKVTTKKDVQESTDKLEGNELLERLMDSAKSEETGKLTDAKSIESLTTEKIITETIKTTSASGTSGIRSDFDSGKSTPDLGSHDEKSETHGKIQHEKMVVDKPEHPRSAIIKDLISDGRSYSGKSSPEISMPKDSHHGKATPDTQASSKESGHSQMSGRSTPDKRPDSRSSTATPDGFRSSESIRTTITTTRTISDDGDIITTTKEVTEATNDKGETTVLAEKTDVKYEDRVLSKDMTDSTYSSGFEGTKASSDFSSEKDFGPASPRSDHSSLHSRAGTHVWGGSEDRHTYSDDEAPGSPLSTTSQVGYSPQSTYHFGEQSFGKDSSRKSMEFSEADMSSSFYGELPDLPPRVTTMKSAYLDSSSEASGTTVPEPIEGDFSFKKFTVEKEFAGGLGEKSGGKRYVDDADLDFEKALMERKEMKRDREHSSAVATGFTNGSLAKQGASSSTSEESKDPKDESKKDPLAGWGSPLGLPSPKPPRKFNLRTTARINDSTDISPDSLNFDAINDWGEPLRLPSPAPVADEASNKGAPTTPKKERKQPKKVITENLKNRKRSESPSKNEKKTKESKNKVQPVYMDLTYVPHHGNSYYTSLEFFKKVRARYYVFSGVEPSREVYDALLDAKKTWEDKDLEVTMIPTYDTDTLGYWVADNEEALAANHIDLSPSASRCTINLQDHETSCSAYRLEF